MPERPSCTVDVQRADDHTTVTVTGDVDLFSAPRLTEALDEALEAPGAIVVDLCECTFMDSNGMYAILMSTRAADEAQRSLVVAAGPRTIPARLLDLTARGSVRVADTRSEALALAA